MRTTFPQRLNGALWVSLLTLLCGCAHRSPKLAESPEPTGARASIRNVDFSRTPEMKVHADRARQLGNEVYPKLVGLLSDDHSELPEQADVRFLKRFSSFRKSYNNLSPTTAGYVSAQGTMVSLDAAVLTAALKSFNSNAHTNGLRPFDNVFVHELAHVAQYYSASTIQRHRYWAEGIADYARFKLGYTNEWDCPKCSSGSSHYTSGYACAGAFLLHLDGRFGESLIRQMNSALRQETFSEDFFLKNTGRTLDKLWTEFEKTSAVEPIARDLYRLEKALGFVNGKAPRNFDARFHEYVKSHPNAAEIKRGLAFVTYRNRPIFTQHPPQVVSPRLTTDKSLVRSSYKFPLETIYLRMNLFLYFSQPGGSPETFLIKLAKDNQLPGDFADEDAISLSSGFDVDQIPSLLYSNSRTHTFRKNKEPLNYNYTVVRDSVGASWRVERAWCASLDGKVLKEFALSN